MAAEWYYAKGNKQSGPISEGELRQRASTGQIAPTDLVWTHGMPQWATAGTVHGLFAAVSGPPPLPYTITTLSSAEIDTAKPIIPDKDMELDENLNKSLAELKLSVRADNCLESEGINTVRDLVVRTECELLQIRNFGEKPLKEIRERLSELGLRLGMRLPNDVELQLTLNESVEKLDDAAAYHIRAESTLQQSRIAYKRGIESFTKEDFDSAFTAFTEAIGLDPNFADAFQRRGLTWRRKGDSEHAILSAICDFTDAIRIDPLNAKAYYNRGYTWEETREFDLAFEDYNEAIRLDPQYAMAYGQRGTHWAKKGDYDSAISDFTEAIRLGSNNAWAYRHRARSHQEKGNHDQAIADATEAIRLNPNNAFGYSIRAESHRAEGNIEDFIEDARKSHRIDPDRYTAYAMYDPWECDNESVNEDCDEEDTEEEFSTGIEQFLAGDFVGARYTFESIYDPLSKVLSDANSLEERLDEEVGEHLAECIYWLALSHIELQNHSHAMMLLSELTALDRRLRTIWMIGDEGLGCERLQDAARHFIGTENWTMADACLKMAMRLAVDHGHSGELFSMFEVVCGSMNSWEMGERWLRELIEEVEEVSEFHSHDGPYSSESKDILLPALGRLRYRGGVDDVVTCFERARWNHTTHDVDFARRQLQAKRWLLEAKGPDDAVGWESKLNDFLHDVRSNALGESVEDYVIIGKSCFGNGQFADSYMKNDPSDASRYHEEAKEWYERALLHLRLALAILPDDHIESVREEIVDPLYWCGRAAFEVGEYVVAISCFERSNGKWPSPDCEEWLEMARLAAAA